MSRFSEFRKKQRMNVLKVAFVLIFCGFFCAYRGGVDANNALIFASFAFFGASIAGIMLVKK